MPSAIILDKDAGLRQGITSAGSALGQALQQRGQYQQKQQQQQQQQQKISSAITQGMQKLGDNPTLQDQTNFINSLVSSGVPSETIKIYSDMFSPQIKANIQEQQDRMLLQEMGLIPPTADQSGFIAAQTSQGVPGMSPVEGVGTESTILEGVTGPSGSMVEESTTEVVPQPGIPQQTPQQNKLSSLSESQLVSMATSQNPTLRRIADAEIKVRDLQQKRDLSERDYQAKFAPKIVEKESGLRKKLRDKEFASSMARNAIESNDIGSFSLSNIGRRLGIRELETASGAQLNQAAKINLVGNLSDISARAQNIWMEQMMSNAFAQVGKTENANLMTMELFDTEKELNRSWLETSDKIKQEDRDKYGNVKWESLDERVSKEVLPLEKEIMGKASFRTRIIYEDGKGDKWLIENVSKKVPKGTPLTPKMAASFKNKYKDDATSISNAKKMGYTIPSREEKNRWQL